MPEYLVRLTKSGGRYAVTIPAKLVKDRGLEYVRYIMFVDKKGEPITLHGCTIKGGTEICPLEEVKL